MGIRRGYGQVVVAVLALALAAPIADARTFTVNTHGDAADASVGDDVCATSTGACTLRAALEEAAGDGVADEIGFTALPDNVVTLTRSPLPTIDEQLTVDACSAQSNPTKPCFGMKAGDHQVFRITGSDVRISGIGVGGGRRALEQAESSARLTLTNNSFGGGGSAPWTEANAGESVLLRGSDARVGGTAPGDRNFFGPTDTSLRLIGAEGAVVEGNDIGEPLEDERTGGFFGVNREGPQIRIEGGAHDNRIGGDTLASQNRLGGADTDWVEVAPDPANVRNSFLRNRGGFTGSLVLVDLGADGRGNLPTGPNEGMQRPNLTVEESRVTGTTRPGATVRVYAVLTPFDPYLTDFLGAATADSTGAVEVELSRAMRDGEYVAFNATSPAGSSSEFGVAQDPSPYPGPFGPFFPTPAPASEATPPPGSAPPAGAVGRSALPAADFDGLSPPRRGVLRVRIDCRQPVGFCDGGVGAELVGAAARSSAKSTVLGTSRFRIAAGRSRVVSIRISRRGKRALRGKRSARIRLTIATFNPAALVRRTVTIRLRP